MAKKENQDNVTGGLTAGLEFQSRTQENEKERPHIPATQKSVGSALTEGYQQVHKRKIETRSAKLNILVKPSTADNLETAVKNGEIRSRNDLINYLLEKYFEEREHKNIGVDEHQNG